MQRAHFEGKTRDILTLSQIGLTTVKKKPDSRRSIIDCRLFVERIGNLTKVQQKIQIANLTKNSNSNYLSNIQKGSGT